jgi:predicted nucleotidyltransferase
MDTTVLVENFCSHDKVAPQYLPVIEAAIAKYRAVFGDAVLNIRLMGSVARGEVTPHSDIDFIALLGISPTEQQLQNLAHSESVLQRDFPFLAKVDMEAITVDDVHEFRRFVFISDSLSLYGADLYPAQTQSFDRELLADMITPDLEDIVQSYRAAIMRIAEHDEKKLRGYSRLTGKDVLKCYRRVALLSGGDFERNIDKIYEQLLHYLPEQRVLLGELHRLYTRPLADGQKLLDVLNSITAVT